MGKENHKQLFNCKYYCLFLFHTREYGLDDFASKPEELQETLRICLQDVADKLVEFGQDNSEVVLFLGATAGMRLLMQNDPDVGQLLFNLATEEIETFDVWTIVDNGVRTITEEEEGIFSWISSNHNEGTVPQL